MEKERLFYLDFIRAIAVMMVVLTHYNANFIGYNGAAQFNKIVLTEFPFGIYLGDLGVGLFMLISGAAMWYVYGNKKTAYFSFVKKRLISILPMFYIAYLGAFLFNFWQNRGFSTNNVSVKYFISTLFGFDSLLATVGVQNFMLVGEWFIGMIIIIYFLFPLLKKLVSENEIIAIFFSIFLLVVFNLSILADNKAWRILQLTIGFVPIFVLGMLLQKYLSFFKNKLFVLPSIAILILNAVLKPEVIPEKIQMFYISLAVFILVLVLSPLFEYVIIRNVVDVISKYSYPIFLIHHFITNKMVNHFDIQAISVKESYLLFLIILPVVFFFSWSLLRLTNMGKKFLNNGKDYVGRKP
ncbi:acyltransferase [Lactococcus hodotermopsidis]|uniref:Acyltransferase n=1 Tax=Pseudolactococcus hodotermopsidis TaxID=2709157 RepID=A0A6A0BD78_9LACT|nr:acyltransferase [Lactococcus hodotermopsidis]GFH42414.1 acyltransferase [Lactococcus hodotermopsidis]